MGGIIKSTSVRTYRLTILPLPHEYWYHCARALLLLLRTVDKRIVREKTDEVSKLGVRTLSFRTTKLKFV